MTSVSSSAEPRQLVCTLESEDLLTAVSKSSDSSDITFLLYTFFLGTIYAICYLMEEVYKKKKAMTFTGYRSKSSIGISFH